MHSPKTMQPSKIKIGIVYGDFYEHEMQTMVDACTDKLRNMGMTEEHISLHPVPGAFEIPLIGAKLFEQDAVDALIGLGIIVKGETEHDEHIARECVRGMMDLQTRYQKPFVYEVLHVNALELARARLHKGAVAAECAINCLAKLARLQP